MRIVCGWSDGLGLEIAIPQPPLPEGGDIRMRLTDHRGEPVGGPLPDLFGFLGPAVGMDNHREIRPTDKGVRVARAEGAFQPGQRLGLQRLGLGQSVQIG